MPYEPDTILGILIGVSTFVLVASLWVGVVVYWRYRAGRKDERVRQRLGLTGEDSSAKVLRLWKNGKSVETIVATDGERRSIFSRIARGYHAAGWGFSFSAFVLGFIGLASLSSFILLVLVQNVVMAVSAPFAIGMVLYVVHKNRLSRRLSLFEKQLVDALELASRSLRAGHPLAGALRLVSEEMPRPINALFGDVCQQHELGVGLDQALRRVASESPSKDLNLFATSVALQIRSGGNLADMMERLASVIKEREKLSRRVRVLTAQTEFSKRVLIGLPILVFALLNASNPEYVDPLYTTSAGRGLLLIAVGALTLGWWVMNRMSNLKF